jgi:1-pyrroline-5-carboxylate dehydrogenase
MTEAILFQNEPFLDFTLPEVKQQMQSAITQVATQLGQTYPLVIAGQTIPTATEVVSTNPANPSQVVGRHAEALPEHVGQAVATAHATFKQWSRTPAADRIALLRRAAQLIRDRHFEFCAWLSWEVGKNFGEADADVGETIDFLEFYALEAEKLDAATTPIQYPGERNNIRYIPLGVGAVIPPWNFPLAIMAGMTAAAIVTGNTVVLKPSPDAPTIAARFLALLHEAGLPQGVVTLCIGGPAFGSALVEHKNVRFIAFTGSKKVGLHIHEQAAKTQPGQHFIKRTILELGGKDAILVDASADLDAAVEGVAVSAFGFSGQKCSACSRAIVDASIYDEFLTRLTARVRKIQSGPPTENFYGGTVINQAAMDRVLGYIDIAKSEGRILTGGHAIDTPEKGLYIAPTVVADIAPTSRLAQEEVFGPLLAVIKSRNFDEALDIVNDTEYGLTGAIYSQTPEHLERARHEFHVGNLYLNRKCTGAMVGAHPFGGFNMSGTDSKAGGPDYLLLFTQAKSVAEKL